jgi:choline/glycine/proline betaine transport protein
MSINKPVFLSSIFIIFTLVILGMMYPNQVDGFFDWAQTSIIVNFDWLYIFAVAVFFIFCVFIAISSHGDIKLGSDDDEPEFTYSAWFAMLFSAGMGIGLLFFGVAEPLMHYLSPPTGASQTTKAAADALSITFFHWGLHAWSIYAVAGLTLAYFSFRQELPLTFRSAMYPILGDKIYSWPGDIIDTIAVISTLLGIATTLGFGVTQINMGISYLFTFPINVYTQIGIIGVIMSIAALSVASGLKRGIRRLSEINIILAIGLLLFVFICGPTGLLLSYLIQNIGNYLSSITEKTFNLYAYEPTGWIGGWTLFYWGWWISWSPFVGMFIARISKGRTVREFILGVMTVPVLFTFIWMTVFGNTAIFFESQEKTAGILSNAVSLAPEAGLFSLLSLLPFSFFMILVALLVIVVFFITSADSGALVIDSMTSSRDKRSSTLQRIFWVFVCGTVSAVILVFGGLEALQTASLIAALPFLIILLVACYGLLKALKLEKLKKLAGIISHQSFKLTKHSWKKRLKNIIDYPTKKEAHEFLNGTVLNAVNKITLELTEQDVSVTMQKENDTVSINIAQGDEDTFYYAIKIKSYPMPSFAMTDDSFDDENEQTRFYRAEVRLAEGGQHYDIMGYTEEDIIADILMQYDKYLHYLHLSN